MEFLGDKRIDSTAVISEPIEYTEGTFAPIEVGSGATEQLDMASPKGPLAGCVNSFFTAPKSGVYTITAFFGAIEPTATTDSMLFIFYGTQTETKIVASSIATGDTSANVSATVRMVAGSILQFAINNRGSVARTYNNPGNNNMQAPSWNISLIQTNVHPVGSGVDPYYFTQAELDALESPAGSGVYPTLEPGRQIIITDTPSPMETTPSDFANYAYSKGEIDDRGAGFGRVQSFSNTQDGVHYNHLPLGILEPDSSDSIVWLFRKCDGDANVYETLKGFSGIFSVHRGSATGDMVHGHFVVELLKARQLTMDYFPMTVANFDIRPALFTRNTTEYWLGFIIRSYSGRANLYFTGDLFDVPLDGEMYRVKYANMAANNIAISQSLPRIFKNIISTEWRIVDQYTINGKRLWTKLFTGRIDAVANSDVQTTLISSITATNFDALLDASGRFEYTNDDASSMLLGTTVVNFAVGFTTCGFVRKGANSVVLYTISESARTQKYYEVVIKVTTTDNNYPMF